MAGVVLVFLLTEATGNGRLLWDPEEVCFPRSVVREVCPGGGGPFSSLKGVTSWGTVGEGSQDENEKDGSRGIGKVGSVIS